MDESEKSRCGGSESENTVLECEPSVTKPEPDPLAGDGQQELPNTFESSISDSTSDFGKDCSSVPSENPIPNTSSHSEMVKENTTTSGNLIIVPTIEGEISDCGNNVEMHKLLKKDLTGSHQNSTAFDTLSDGLGKTTAQNETNTVRDDKCSGDTLAECAQGESVLPSMGILPKTETEITSIKPSKTSPPTEGSSSSTSVEEPNHESSSPEMTTPADPSNVVHKIKKIKWQDIEVPIITQNNNGPCPLLAIVNVMLLKGQITLPSDRSEITGGELVLVVGNALFDQPRNTLPSDMRRHLEQNTEDAISILHKLLTGLDVNIKFSGVRDFEFTGELCIFDLLGIMLYHGWVVDPTTEVAEIIRELSYNQLTNNIFAWREEAIKNNNNDLLVKAMLCEEFMASSGSQLTIHGLFELGSALAKEEIAVLFRNNHFSTIYKKGDQLYQLLTDQGFLHENMVWETLNDVDATFSEFVNGNFLPVTPAPEATISSAEVPQTMTMQQQINSDQQLAAMLQHEVDLQQRQQRSFERLKDSLGLHNMSDEEIAQKLQEEENRLAAEAEVAASTPRQNVTTPLPVYQASRSPNSQEDKRKKECIIL